MNPDWVTIRLLKLSGFFSWGKDSWVHEEDEGTVVSTEDALEAVKSGKYSTR